MSQLLSTQCLSATLQKIPFSTVSEGSILFIRDEGRGLEMLRGLFQVTIIREQMKYLNQGFDFKALDLPSTLGHFPERQGVTKNSSKRVLWEEGLAV